MRLPFDTILVINLERRPDKYERMMSRIKELGLDKHAKVIRVDAVDGTIINNQWLDVNGIKPLPDYYDSYRGRGITMGEIGCSVSHHKCWEMIAEEGGSIGSALILEDDAQFHPDFIKQIQEINNTVKDYSWELFYLGRKRINMVDEKEVFPGIVVPEFSYWCLSYIVNKSGAKKLINSNFTKGIIPADEFVPMMIGKPNIVCQKYVQNYNLDILPALALTDSIIKPENMAFVSSETEKTDVFFENKFYNDGIDRFMLITVGTEENDQLDRFRKSCEYYGVPYKILGLGEEWNGGEAENGVLKGFGGGQKVNLLRKELKSWLEIKNHIIMFTDSYDVVLLQNPQEILSKFRQFQRPIVFSSEKTCWPSPDLSEKYPESQTEYKYLNSGGFIGYVDSILELIKDEIGDKDDDQLYYTEKYLSSLAQFTPDKKIIDKIPENEYPIGDSNSRIGWMSEPVFDQEIKTYLKNQFSPDAKILDIGAGDGKWSYVLGDYFKNMDAIEIFEEYKERYNLEEKYKKVFIGDFTEFEFDYYDVLILGDVFEHITEQSAKEWLNKVKRKCKDIIVVVPFEYEQNWDGKYENKWGHHHQPNLNVQSMRESYPELTLYEWVDKSDSTGKGKGFGMYVKSYGYHMSPNIFLDTNQFMFQTLNDAINDIEIDVIGKVRNTVTDNYPSVIHANGPKECKDFLNNKSNYMYGNYDFVYGNKSTLTVIDKAELTVNIGVFFFHEVKDINQTLDQVSILKYPKNKISLKLYYNDNNDIYKLEKFVKLNKHLYESIEIIYSESTIESRVNFLEDSTHDYHLMMDSNYIFRNTNGIEYLMDVNKKIVSPMIVSETSSFVNFHTNDMDNKFKYMSYSEKGLWTVEIISGIILIQKEFVGEVRESLLKTTNHSDGDWDIKMSENLRSNGNFLYICNNHYFGSII